MVTINPSQRLTFRHSSGESGQLAWALPSLASYVWLSLSFGFSEHGLRDRTSSSTGRSRESQGCTKNSNVLLRNVPGNRTFLETQSSQTLSTDRVMFLLGKRNRICDQKLPLLIIGYDQWDTGGTLLKYEMQLGPMASPLSTGEGLPSCRPLKLPHARPADFI